jgi:hypothetical protein
MRMPGTALVRSSRLLVGALVVAIVASCGGGSAGSGAGSSPAISSGAATTPATPQATTAVPSGEPAIATPVDGPTVIDVAHEVVVSELVPPTGTTLTADGATLLVPPGAVASDTKVEITRLDAPYRQNPYAPDEPGAVPAVSVGPALDFGPAGVTFTAPVSVTLAYDQALVPAGYEQVAVAYWTGTRWAILGGTVDATAHTVTISQDAFEGEILTTIAIATGVGLIVHAGIKWWYGSEAVQSDPISDSTAAGWITPDDPAVAAAAGSANVGGVPLGDKAQLAEYLRNHPDITPAITVTGSNGTGRKPTYSAEAGSNWQQPASYLGRGLKGDCTDVTNAMVSIFRNLGYPARAVFGYVVDKDSPHVWGEVAIDGKPYLIDEEGQLQPLDAAMTSMHLIRPDPGDPRAFMWDENGQVPYRAEWWDATAINGSWKGTFTLTEVKLDESVAAQAEDQGCTAEVLEALKGKPFPMTMDITVNESGKGTAVTLIDLSSLKDSNGKAPTSSPQTFKVTYADGTLKFKVDSSGGATTSMSGHLREDPGAGFTIDGTMSVSGQGFSAKAVWEVAR